MSILALTPRRLIYIPRTTPKAALVVRFTEIVEIRADPIFAKIIIILHDRKIDLVLRPRRRKTEFVAYVKDRLTRR